VWYNAFPSPTVQALAFVGLPTVWCVFAFLYQAPIVTAFMHELAPFLFLRERYHLTLISVPFAAALITNHSFSPLLLLAVHLSIR
jgi:hypothetical protein